MDQFSLVSKDVSGQRTGTRMYEPQTVETSHLIWMPREEGATSGDLCQPGASVSSGDQDPEDEDSLETDSLHIEEDEEIEVERGHYDCRHMIDMGNGDRVQGYK